MIVADTNIVSEFMRPRPKEHVLTWARGLAAAELTISVVTVEEVERGIRQLPRGRRRRELEQIWERLLDGYGHAIATYDVAAAHRTAEVLVEARRAGRPMSLADAQIAGICLAGEYQLATRNPADFSGVPGLSVVDPFSPAGA